MQEPDFAELSQYKSTQHGMPKYTSVPYTSNNFGMAEYTARGGGGYYEDTGFDDLTYDYINGSELARTVAKADENTLGLTEAGIGSDRLQRMTPDEIAIYNYLYSKQGPEAANEFIEFIATDPNYSEGSLNARQRQHEEEMFAEEARENPFGASLYTVLNSPRRGLAYVGQIGDLMENGEIDQNAGYNRYSYADTAIRNEVSKTIEESGKWGSVGSFLYNTGMSMGDFLLQGALFGGVSENLSLAIMGTGAAADATIAAKDRGLDDTNAFALGTIAGFAEIVTEKVSLDTLLGEAAKGRGALAYLLSNVVAEGSEEGASDLINWAADIIVAGDDSEWRTAVRKYEEQGMSESKAFGQAVADKLGDIGMDVLGGMISGGIMGAPGAIYQGTINRRAGAAGSAEGTQQTGAAPVQQDSTVIDTDEDGHTPEERRVIEEYQGAVDQGLVDFYNAAQSDGNASGSYQLKDVSDRAAAEVKRILGRDVSGFRTVIDARQARHISNDHGASGRSDRTMADANDVGRIQYVLDNFDTAEYGGRSGAYVERSASGRNRHAPTVKFSKKVDGTYFVIEAAPDTQAKTMYVVTAYMLGEGKTPPGSTNKMTGEASPSLDAETPRLTSENETENTSPVNDSIPQPGQDVNTEQARPAAVQAYDTARMVRAGAALGESGEKALNASYDPAIPADRYYRGFSEYYEAGVQGRSESDVKQDSFTSALNSAQRYAAYSAGRNDAAASLAREERAKNFAKTAGEDSGLVFDDYVSRELDETTANRINATAKRLGTRVRFVEPGSIRGGTANAAISGAEVLIEKNNPNPVMFLLGHEWTHRMQELAPQEYRRFRQAAAGVEDVRLNAERTMELYRRQGVELTYEEALDEAAADYAGQMLDEDGAVLDRFIAEHRDDRTLLQRVRDAIRSLVNRLTGRERRGAESAVRKLDEALRAAERQAARLSENSGNAREGGTRYSFGGIGAEQANRVALAHAESMEREGADPEQIRRDTGWFRGVDGLWRFEMDDSGMETQTTGRLMRNPDARRYNELFERAYLEGSASEQDLEELQILEKNMRGVRKTPMYLDEIVKHDELFENYPALRDITVRFERDTGNSSGAYNPAFNEIVVRQNLKLDPNRLKDVLVHEIQHAIQAQEGFAVGTSPEYMSEQNPTLDSRASYDMYLNTAGEVEARDAAARRNFTEQQRRETRPNLGDENTIFADRAQYSFGDGENQYAGRSMTEDSEIYSYDFLTSLPDMQTVTLPDVDAVRNKQNRVDTGLVLSAGINNARTVGTVQGGKILVRNSYTGTRLLVTRESIRHGLNGNQSRLLTNARLGAVIGDVVKNAVPINALHDKAAGVTGTYAMAGYAVDSRGREFIAIVTVEQYNGNISGVEVYDVTHAVSGRQKKGSQADTKSQGFYPIKATTISISDLLNIVKSTHQSILSEDVLEQLGEARNPEGDYAGKIKFSLKGYSVSEDSEGRGLSAEQQEFFRESKVRDEEGRLRPRTVCIFVCILYLKTGVNTFAISNVLSQRRRPNVQKSSEK